MAMNDRRERNRIRRAIVVLGVVSMLAIMASANRQHRPRWRIVKEVSPRSLDNRDSGTGQQSGYELRPPWLRTVFFADESNGWAAGEDSVFLRTTDGGEHWSEQDLDRPSYQEGIFFINPKKGWVLNHRMSHGFVYNGRVFRNTIKQVILKTEDGGASWKEQLVPDEFSKGHLRAIWFVDELRGWAVGTCNVTTSPSKLGSRNLILATTDGGEHWDVQLFDDPCKIAPNLSAVRFVDSLRGFAVGSYSLLATEDGGKTWRTFLCDENLNLHNIDFADRDNGWAIGGDVLLRTSDGGRNWDIQPLPQGKVWEPMIAIKFADSKTGWLGGVDGKVIHTTDGGKTWGPQETPLTARYRGGPPEKWTITSIAATSKSVFAVTTDGVIMKLDR
jgi:photosystem II stability/assembly factor-like uncharacterized protein